MITKWTELKLPALNLLNWPKQPSIKYHEFAISEQGKWVAMQEKELWVTLSKIASHQEWERNLRSDIKKVEKSIKWHEDMMKEKKHLHYLRTGRAL